MPRNCLISFVGQTFTCCLCQGPILPGQPMLCIAVAPLPKWEPLTNFEDKTCHPACWSRWSLRPQFVARFNHYSEDGRIHDDGSVEWLRPDGTVDEHDRRIRILEDH